MSGGYLEDDDIVDRADMREEQRDHRLYNVHGTLRAMFATSRPDVDEDYHRARDLDREPITDADLALDDLVDAAHREIQREP